MATVVQLELMVDEKGAVQGVRTFDAAIKGTQGTTASLDATLKQLNATLEKTATAGSNAGRNAGRSLRQVKEEGLSAKEGVHLVTEEFDIHMPRALRNLISQSSVATSAVKALSGAIIGIGAIQIGAMVFSQLYEAVHKVWEEHLSLTKAAEDYEQELEKIRQQDFGNSSSIETTILRIQQATSAVEAYKRASSRMAEQSNPLGGQFNYTSSALKLDLALPGAGTAYQWYVNRSVAHDLQQKQYDQQRQVDKLTPEKATQQHDLNLKLIEYNHRLDDTLPRLQKITAQEKMRYEQSAENRNYFNLKNAALGNPVDWKHGGEQEDLLTRGIAEGEAASQRFELEKEQAREIAKLKEEALESGLRGEALYAAQEKFAIDELRRDELYSAAAVNAIKEKFHNEQMDRYRAQEEEIRKMHEQTELGDLTGIAKIRKQGQNRIDDLVSENAQSKNPATPAQLQAKVKEIQDQTNQAVVQAQRSFSDQVNSILEQSAERTVQGFARIHAEAQKQIADLERDFKEKGGDPKDLERGEAGIRRDEATQVRDLQQHNADETAQIEAQAHARSLSSEKQQTAAIEAEYQERLRLYREQKEKEGLSEDDFNRRVAAAEEERNGQMVQAAREAREKMASQFTSFFKNPLDAMKEMGEKAAGEMAAGLVQRMQGTASPSQGGEHLGLPSAFGGIFDRIGKFTHPAAAQQAAHPGETAAASKGAFAMASAEIRVGSANIHLPAIAGGTSPSSSSGGAIPSFSGSGSTSLLNIPGAEFGAPGGSTAEASLGHGGSGIGAVLSQGSAAPPEGTSSVGRGLGNFAQGVGLLKQAKGIWGSEGSTASAAGDSGSPFQIAEEPLQKLSLPGKSVSSTGGMLGGGGVLANAGGAAGGAMGLFSAYQGNGGVGGALGGAMSGMELGMAVGGPIGAAVGLVGGAILGAIGFGGREKGRVYDLKTVRPRLAADFQGFQAGSMDYTSAYSDMQALDQDARKTLDKMGGSARAYYWDTINKEIHQAEAKLTAEEKAGRSQFTMSAAQFDQGGWSEYDGWAQMRRGEFVVHEQPAAEHAGALEAIRAGASHRDMARYYGLDQAAQGYRASMQTASPSRSSSNSVTHNWNVRAIDSKSFENMLMDGKHSVRKALNSSYAENSGSADA